jgi:hypothetical protein
MRNLALYLVLLAAASKSEACSFTFPVDQFPATKPASFDKGVPNPPALLVDARLAYRPKRLSPTDVVGCDIQAEFEVTIKSEDKEKRKLTTFGYYFRIIDPTERWTSVVSVPIKAEIEDGVGLFRIAVTDWPLDPSAPIDIDVEVFAVDDEMRIGPATRFRLHADAN